MAASRAWSMSPSQERGHSRAALLHGHEDVHVGVAQDADNRVGELLIVVVGINIHEIDDAGPAQWGRGLSSPGRAARRVKRGARDPGQDPDAGNAGEPLEQPARRSARSRKLVMIGNRLAGGPRTRPGRKPNRWRKSVLLDKGRLGLEHQARDVDRRGALESAELAMDAQIGMRLELVAAPEPGVDWPVAISRTRLACDRGDAASCRRARKLGHMRMVGSRERQVPQPCS